MHKHYIEKLLATADIRLQGNRPWDLHIHDERIYRRVLQHGTIGLGESYMDGWWDCQQLDEFFNRILRAKLYDHSHQDLPFLLNIVRSSVRNTFAKLFNYQSKRRARQVGRQHYDLSIQLYQRMLDSRLNYSCAYWEQAENLEQAQEAKLDLVCRKLQLRPGMKVLDVGCGWGGFSKYAAEHYQVEVIGLTISKEQAAYAQQSCAGLPVEIRFQDYRELHETVDRIVSIGMFEHVGVKNYQTFMDVMARNLKDEGLFLLHTIGSNTSDALTNEWVNHYIFPNGQLPSVAQIGQAIEKNWVMEDWHNFGPDYDKTLMAWHQRFNQTWPEIQSLYDARFFRMWNYYLLSCAGAFRARYIQLWQIVFSKGQRLEKYRSVR